MKKVFSILMCITLILSLSIIAYADNTEKVFIENGAVMIIADSLEEFNAIVEENEAHNQYVECLWNKALLQAGGVVLSNCSNKNQLPRSYEVNSVYHVDRITLLKIADMYFSATYNTGTDSNGNTIISSVYYLDAYGSTNSTTIQINDSQYTMIDHDRTIAANYSCRVGVVFQDQTYYYSRGYYVEFYATGGANVY